MNLHVNMENGASIIWDGLYSVQVTPLKSQLLTAVTILKHPAGGGGGFTLHTLSLLLHTLDPSLFILKYCTILYSYHLLHPHTPDPAYSLHLHTPDPVITPSQIILAETDNTNYCGLCGNADGDSGNDLASSSGQLPVLSLFKMHCFSFQQLC